MKKVLKVIPVLSLLGLLAAPMLANAPADLGLKAVALVHYGADPVRHPMVLVAQRLDSGERRSKQERSGPSAAGHPC